MKKFLLMTLLASSLVAVSNGQPVLSHIGGSGSVAPCTDQTYFVTVYNLPPGYKVCSVLYQWTFAGSSTVHSLLFYDNGFGTSVTINVSANMNLTATPTIGAVPDCSSSYSFSSASISQAVATQTLSWSSSNTVSSCGSSQTYSINPINCAVSYNYFINENPSGVYFTGTSNSQSLTATTATSVGVTFPAGGGGFSLRVSPNYADGTTGTEVGVAYSYGIPPLTVTVNKIVGITAVISTQYYAGYDYTWTVNGAPPNNGATGNTCQDELICGKTNPIKVVATNDCGTTSATGGAFVKCGGGGPLSLTPNPTHGAMKVMLQADGLTDSQSKDSRIRAIRIVDLSGRIVKKFEFGSGVMEANITTEGLSPNIYILHIFNGKEWTHLEIIVK